VFLRVTLWIVLYAAEETIHEITLNNTNEALTISVRQRSLTLHSQLFGIPTRPFFHLVCASTKSFRPAYPLASCNKAAIVFLGKGREFLDLDHVPAWHPLCKHG